MVILSLSSPVLYFNDNSLAIYIKGHKNTQYQKLYLYMYFNLYQLYVYISGDFSLSLATMIEMYGQTFFFPVHREPTTVLSDTNNRCEQLLLLIEQCCYFMSMIYC